MLDAGCRYKRKKKKLSHPALLLLDVIQHTKPNVKGLVSFSGQSDSDLTDTVTGTLQLSSMSGMRTMLTSAIMVGALGVGYGMWSVISPGEERRREMIKNLPESNPLRMEETRQRNALVMQALKDAAETSENLARGLGPSK
uniref:Ubiquinol-cytochrome-c reductase complex assembly factor 3 n=1 Tax=Oreochromis niloticus TaxID=8128 RepID=A0A669CEH6_ORENI